MTLPEVSQVDYNASVPVVPSLTVTGGQRTDGGALMATVGLVAGYYVRAAYYVTPGGYVSLMGWRSERADIAGAEERSIESAVEWCGRGRWSNGQQVAS